MDNGIQRLHNGDRMRALPDISPQVDADRPLLHPVIDKFKDLQLCLAFGTARNDHRHRTPIRHLFKPFVAIIGLDDFCSQFRRDTAGEGQIAGGPLFQLFADSGHCHDRNAVVLAFIH